MCEAERALGLDSILCNIQEETQFDHVLDADVHVSHTHFPDGIRSKLTKPLKLVWVGHGTPEHVFQTSVESGTMGGYGHGDGLMLIQHWMKTADALVTFWPRHQAIWKSMCDKATIVDCVPLGVDRSFWSKVPSRGRYAGSPSVLTAENCHYIKWPLDLLIAWPWVYPQIRGASLHVLYLPTNLHRWFFPLVNANGASYGCHISPLIYEHTELRHIFSSIDFFIGLVRYGDFNRLSLEAASCGCKTISYIGNNYADYWIPEGDQRIIAGTLLGILKGDIEPRPDKLEVPDIAETALAMKAIYERIA